MPNVTELLGNLVPDLFNKGENPKHILREKGFHVHKLRAFRAEVLKPTSIFSMGFI